MGGKWVLRRFQEWRRFRIHRLQSRSRIVNTAYGEIEASVHGKGKAVLLVHGSPGGYDAWATYQDIISAGFQLICPSRPGYLRTPLTSGINVEEQADLFVALLDELKIDTVAVIGFSGGGPVALQIALRHSKRVNALVLESAVTYQFSVKDSPEGVLVNSANFTKPAQRLVYWFTHRLVYRIPGIAAMVLFATTTSHEFSGQRDCTQQILRSPKQIRLFWRIIDGSIPFSVRQEGYFNDMTQFEALSEYPFTEIDTLTLIIHSKKDKDVPIEHANFIHEQITNSELFLVEGCGHFVWLGDSGEKVRQHRNNFLKNALYQ